MNCNEEIIIKIIGKTTLEYPDIDQLKLRDILYEVFYKYETFTLEQSLVASDIEDRLIMYLAVKKLDGLSDKTLYNYRLVLLKFASYIHKPISTVNTNDIRMYLAITTKDLKSTTVGTILSTLKSFFGWLANEEIILKDPTRKLKTPKVPIRLRSSLTTEELERLRDACKTLRQRAMLEFLFSTGTRVGEAVSVKRGDISWQTMSLKVIGKGNKERIVYISDKSKLYVQKYLGSRTDDNPALFISMKHPFTGIGIRAMEREIGKIAENAGFDKSIYPHLLRHTMATLGLRAGASLTTIQKLLGHEDPGTTEIYAEIGDETVAQEYRKHLAL